MARAVQSKIMENTDSRVLEMAEAVMNMLTHFVADLLGMNEDNVDVSVSLLDQGFESLMIIELQNRIEDQLNISTSVEEMIGCESIESIAEYIIDIVSEQIRRNPGDETMAEQVEPVKQDLYTPFALTDVQQAYWVGKSGGIDLGHVATHLYYEFDSRSVDIVRLNSALNRLIDRHPMLRCIVHPNGTQQILENVPLYSIETLDLQNHPDPDVAGRLQTLRQAFSTLVLDSATWPLFSVKAVKTDAFTRLMIYIDNLIMDGASLVIFFKELRMFYLDPLYQPPDLEYTFNDHVLSEPNRFEDPSYLNALDYWKHRIPELPPGPELSLAKDVSSLKQGHQTVRIETLIDKEDWMRIKKKAQSLKLSPSGVLLTAYAYSLNMWSKEPRFSINMTVFNRPSKHPQINDIIGDFTNLTLVAFDGLEPGSFADHAKSMQSQIWKNLDHIQTGFLKILREYRTYHGNHSSVLFPVVFTSLINPYQEALYQELQWLGEEVYMISQTPQVLIDHIVQEKDGNLHAYWDYVEEVFPENYIRSMFSVYTQVLKSLVEDDSWDMPDAGRFFPSEQRAVREQANRTDMPLPVEMLHTLASKSASQYPDHPAVISQSTTLTYRQLDILSNRLAWALIKDGASRNTLIAVIMEKGWEQIVAVLAILKAGAAYLPIEARLPQNRIDFILSDAHVEQIVTQSSLTGQLEGKAQMIYTVGDGLHSDQADTVPETQITPDDLAYVIYTSGSTGNPKGVMINHTGAVNTLLDINRRFGITPKDKIFGISSLSFDLSVYDIFGALAAGATLVLPDSESERDPRHWADMIEHHGVTVWNSAPALMELLTDYMLERNLRLPDDFRLVMMSGDWIPVVLPDTIRMISNNPHIHSLGGATEASIWSIFYPITQVEKEWKSIPYGKPLANQRFHVLNKMLLPCPDWVPGELFISGTGLAQGYWENPKKTESSFMTHPKTGERLYRTGDLGRYLPDGTLEFLGRDDFQIKISGYRIELEEIESVLLQNENVQGAVVTTWGGAGRNTGLAAYIIAKYVTEARNSFTKSLRNYLKERLPAYMVPSKIIMVDHFPLSSNGKVDRKALPHINGTNTEELRASRTPENVVEEVLAELVREILNAEIIGMDDDLYMSGMDSLQAVRLNAKIQDVFQVGIPLSDLLDLNTLGKMAAYLMDEEVTPGMLTTYADIYMQVLGMSDEEIAMELSDMNETEVSS